MNIPSHVKDLCGHLTNNGLRPMIVGGAVIDIIHGFKPEDWDIEVYGSSLDDLQSVLESAGYHPKTAGKKFGILVVRDMDVSVPRKDNKTGKGHKDFKVEFDPFMTPYDGARRRDFTINSMYYDFIEEEIIDPFGGLQDLEDGILRATDPKLFIEDPLRALRAVQILARKAKTVEPETIELIRSMKNDFQYLPPERLYEEFRKLLLKADKPSIGLELLRETDWVENFPALYDLIGCPQNSEYHPEGDVWIHTLQVVDRAVELKDRVVEDWQLPFMFSALLHDVGKPSTTDDEFRAFGHAKKGSDIAREFMRGMRASKENADRVAALVGNHMQPLCLNKGNAKEPAWKRLHNKCRLDVLGHLSHADRAGVGDRTIEDECERGDLCQKYFEKFGNTPEPIERILKGRHLIEIGLTPGPQFKEYLDKAYQAQLEDPNLTVEQLLHIAVIL